jgi:glutamate-1-semialdehyde 2,1-aminomutase
VSVDAKARPVVRIDEENAAALLCSRYEERTPRSATLHRRAREVMPGGDTRTVAFHPPYPLTIDYGMGCEIVDVDGNSYIDLLNNYTSMIHGHAHPAINAAVQAQIARGTSFASALESQNQLAQLMTSRVESVDKIRFANSGTEATMNALRAARAFTGRERIVKIEGGYHGTYDDFEVSVRPSQVDRGSDDKPTATIDSPGVPRNRLDLVDVLPFNNLSAAERLFEGRGAEIAAGVVEPVMGAAGMIPAQPEYLHGLQALAREHGALLILDEVMSFRLGYGGIQEHYGVKPDLTTFAKIIGGGYPVGAFGGSDAIMSMFDPSSTRPLWQSGTFNGNAVTMVAGTAALQAFGAEEVERINRLGDTLRSRLSSVFLQQGLQANITGVGSFGAIHFVDGEVTNYRDAASGNQMLKRLLHLSLLVNGIYCAPRLMFCMSTPMSEATIDEIVSRFARAIDDLIQLGAGAN